MVKKPTNKQSQCGPVPEWYRDGWKPSYFCIYAKHAAGLLALDDATLGKLYRAQLSYLLDRASTPPNEGIISLAFNFCRASMDEDFEHGLSRSWQAYCASNSREGVEAAKEGVKHRTTSDDNGRCRELSNINTITQEQHRTQEHNNSKTSKQQETQETSSTHSSCEKAHEAEGDLMDEDNLSSFSLEDLRAFCKWVLPQHGYNDIDFNAYLRSNSNPTLDNLINYIFDVATQGGISEEALQSDAKDFVKEMRRRRALGLSSFAPEDWNEDAMRELFDGLQIPEEDMRRFYDADCSHDEDTALSWICQECYHGTAGVEELRQELEEKRKEVALAEIVKTPNKDLTRGVLEAYIKLQGYDLCDDDIDRILQADIHSRWPSYVDKCAENADSGDGNLF